MSRKLLAVIVPNETRRLPIKIQNIVTLLMLTILSACAPITQEPVIYEAPKVIKSAPVTKYSAQAMIPGQPIDVRFAQQALTKLGYKIGPVDGLWGPRSATAIREFESKQGITSANGHLSELNIHELEVVSGLSRNNIDELPAPPTPPGITAKLDPKTPLSAGPQLIIVEHEYDVLSKPNPYSSTLLVLAPGTGIYVISQQDGYFEVESINRKRGYIKVD